MRLIVLSDVYLGSYDDLVFSNISKLPRLEQNSLQRLLPQSYLTVPNRKIFITSSDFSAQELLKLLRLKHDNLQGKLGLQLSYFTNL